MWTRPAGPGNFGEGREYQIVRYTDRVESERDCRKQGNRKRCLDSGIYLVLTVYCKKCIKNMQNITVAYKYINCLDGNTCVNVMVYFDKVFLN